LKINPVNALPKTQSAVRDPGKLSLLFELSRAFSSLIELDELLAAVNSKTREVLDVLPPLGN